MVTLTVPKNLKWNQWLISSAGNDGEGNEVCAGNDGEGNEVCADTMQDFNIELHGCIDIYEEKCYAKEP
ncbi:hypothetical protein DPMN_041223 [Dreissena polymorpha]|uniref:Uncharacterized protein n=1 Tax=Dreissena polymorpha TaxID=45954 RepID=A0A9D4CWF4_DREPO|nr:hypothetical protein DPMN_041223 [Dreissena polymorpha]